MLRFSIMPVLLLGAACLGDADPPSTPPSDRRDGDADDAPLEEDSDRPEAIPGGDTDGPSMTDTATDDAQDTVLPGESGTPVDTADPGDTGDTAPSVPTITDGPSDWTGGFVDATAGAWTTGTYAVATERLPTTHLAQPIDLDGDGRLEIVAWDLVTVATGVARRPAVLVRDDTTETWHLDEALADDLLGQGVRGAWSAVDLDGDGHPDIIQPGGRDDAFVLHGDGSGHFQRADLDIETHWSGPAWGALAVADHDEDGVLDVVMAQGTCNDARPVVTVLRRTGERQWQEHVPPGDHGLSTGPRITAVLPMGSDNAQRTLSLGGACFGRNAATGFLRPTERDPDGWLTLEPFDPAPPHVYFRLRPDMQAGMVNWVNPMGAAVADFDANGTLELLVTTSDATQLFLEEQVDDDWLERSQDFDLQFPKLPGTTEREAWGAAPIDLDFDGWPDLVIAQSDDTIAATFDPATRASFVRVFWNDRQGGFVDVSERLGLDAALGNWQSVVARDVDNDGDTDLVVGGYGFFPRVWRNELTVPGRRLSLHLVGTTSNHLAIGARVSVTAPGVPPQTRIVGDAFSPQMVVTPTMDLGLGLADAADEIQIDWPSGYTLILRDVPPGERTVAEPVTLQVDGDTRHASADGSTCVGISLTPRAPDGSLAPDPTARIEQVAGNATWDGPATWDGTTWHRCLRAPTETGSSVVEATLLGRPLRVRPRIVWRAP